MSGLATALVLFAAVLSIPAILGILALVLEPEPLAYTNIPFPVVTPLVAPGEQVTFEVGRCVNDPLAPDPVVYLYTVELVNDENGSQTSLSGGSAAARHGCDIQSAQRDVVPLNTPPGHYHVEGITTAGGRFRTVVIRFWSQSFVVD